MKILNIWHNGKDEYGNDGHTVEIRLDDDSTIFVVEGSEFHPKRQVAAQTKQTCPSCLGIGIVRNDDGLGSKACPACKGGRDKSNARPSPCVSELE